MTRRYSDGEIGIYALVMKTRAMPAETDPLAPSPVKQNLFCSFFLLPFLSFLFAVAVRIAQTATTKPHRHLRHVLSRGSVIRRRRTGIFRSPWTSARSVPSRTTRGAPAGRPSIGTAGRRTCTARSSPASSPGCGILHKFEPICEFNHDFFSGRIYSFIQGN